MSALDQAFIRAYRRQQSGPAPALRDAPAIPLSEALKLEPAQRVYRVDLPMLQAGKAQPAAAASAADVEADEASEMLVEVEVIDEPDEPSDELIDEPDAGIAAGTAEEPSFRPMFQVERFAWPSICRRVAEMAPAAVDALADRFATAAEAGPRILAIASCRRDEGATTMLFCASRRLAERGKNVILVDADPTAPSLAAQLELQPQCGWQEVLAGRQPLEEAVIESTAESLSLLPLTGPLEAASRPEQPETRLVDNLATLAAHYDLVLVDWGPLEESGAAADGPIRAIGGLLGGIALVHHAAITSPERLAALCRCLPAAEIASLGIIRNFVCN